MATYLQICQAVARESGTIATTPAQPTTVVNQVGRLNKVVHWVAEAWVQIQNKHKDWRFRRKEFTGTLLTATGTYTPASFSITDLLAWPPINPAEPDNITIYDPAIGVADEGPVRWLDWPEFRRRYRRGAQTNDRPRHYSVSPANELCIGPAPDKPYTINGEYIRTAQRLTADADVPLCPADYHEIIQWRAVQLLAEHDEGEWQTATANSRYSEYLSAMAITELERPYVGGTSLA